jgi:hypothetical protein
VEVEPAKPDSAVHVADPLRGRVDADSHVGAIDLGPNSGSADNNGGG